MEFTNSERLEEIVEIGIADLEHYEQQHAIGLTAFAVGQTAMGERWMAEALGGIGPHLALWLRDFEAETSRLQRQQRLLRRTAV